MGLEKRQASKTIYLQVKHYCLWLEIKAAVDGCEEVTVTNPTNKKQMTKYGYSYDTVSGRALKMDWYDRESAGKRFLGYKLHLRDGADVFSIDMPYQSQVLRKFLKIAPNINWDLPLSLTVFKGKPEEGKTDPETGIWFRQDGVSVPWYFTKDNPRGMPAATQDSITKEWDFKPQQRWLVERLKGETIPAIIAAAAKFAPPTQPQQTESHGEETFDEEDGQPPFAPVEDEGPRSAPPPQGASGAGSRQAPAFRPVGVQSRPDNDVLRQLLAEGAQHGWEDIHQRLFWQVADFFGEQGNNTPRTMDVWKASASKDASHLQITRNMYWALEDLIPSAAAKR